MAEDTNVTLKTDAPELGQIEMDPEVLETIAGIAASQTEGVAKMQGSLANSVTELFGRKEHGKGVKVSFDEGKLNVDVYVMLEYGVTVPKVAADIQENVKQQLLFMTEFDTQNVDVHVEGVIPEKITSTVDPDDIFGDQEAQNNKENGEK